MPKSPNPQSNEPVAADPCNAVVDTGAFLVYFKRLDGLVTNGYKNFSSIKEAKEFTFQNADQSATAAATSYCRPRLVEADCGRTFK